MKPQAARLIGGKAYGIFREELARHLAAAKKHLDCADTLPKENVYRALALTFHTVKGSAGFFGFDEIASAANGLQRLLLGTEEDVRKRIGSIQCLLREIEAALASLPEARLPEEPTAGGSSGEQF